MLAAMNSVQQDIVANEVYRLMQALEALANPCCRGQGTSVFRIMGRDGKPTGEEVRLCDGCGREVDAPL